MITPRPPAGVRNARLVFAMFAQKKNCGCTKQPATNRRLPAYDACIPYAVANAFPFAANAIPHQQSSPAGPALDERKKPRGIPASFPSDIRRIFAPTSATSMTEPPAFAPFREAVRAQLYTCGVVPAVADAFADALPFEMAAGHALACVNQRFYQRSQLTELCAAMGFRTPTPHPTTTDV